MTATLQPESKSSSRRALLAGALGGIGAWAAAAIGKRDLVRAGVDGDVVLGTTNNAGSQTQITNNTTNAAVFGATAFGTGTAITGTSANGTGIIGESLNAHIGVDGASGAPSWPGVRGMQAGGSTGVQGYSGAFATVPAAKPKTGVYGYAAQDGGSRGVTGESPAGIGVYGISATGYGGYFDGKVYTTKWYELTEIGVPTAPAANRARLFIKDNGAGKTQLCVRFNTGAVQVVATQP
jgi:hypothetical protein